MSTTIPLALFATAGLGGLLLVLVTGLAVARMPARPVLREVVIAAAATLATAIGTALMAFGLGAASTLL